MKRIFACVLFAAVLCAALPVASRDRTGTLEGTVVSANGKPVAGARVTAQNSDGMHPRATSTNSEGRFFFTRFLPELYDLRAYHNGVWSDWHRNITVRSGKATNVTIVLPTKSAK